MGIEWIAKTRAKMHLENYAPSTIKSYCYWINEFLSYWKGSDFYQLEEKHLEDFLSYLAEVQKVTASTQNQAFNGILYFYKTILNLELKETIDALRARPRKHLPVVLSASEAKRIILEIQGKVQLMTKLLLGSGLRVSECVNLRIKDVDFERRRILVWNSKSKNDRETILPGPIFGELVEQRDLVRHLHEEDLSKGRGSVILPGSLHNKFPKYHLNVLWQFFFPSKVEYINPKSKLYGRGYVNPMIINKAVRAATIKAGVLKRVTAHTFRHTFATQLLENGCDIRTIQTILGHKHISTTMIYTHVAKNLYANVRSPLEWIL